MHLIPSELLGGFPGSRIEDLTLSWTSSREICFSHMQFAQTDKILDLEEHKEGIVIDLFDVQGRGQTSC